MLHLLIYIHFVIIYFIYDTPLEADAEIKHWIVTGTEVQID